MANRCLNAYKIMWLFVIFDLPVTTPEERRYATKFRNDLLDDGFTMMQYSVYVRHCASKEAMDVHIKRVKSFLPPDGKVSMVFLTDKQYGEIINFWGRKIEEPKEKPRQLELFVDW